MKCDMRFFEDGNVELRLVLPRAVVDQVTRNAPSYGQACKLVREKIEASLAHPVTQALQLERMN